MSSKQVSFQLRYLLLPAVVAGTWLWLMFSWRALFIKLGIELIEQTTIIMTHIIGIGAWLSIAWLMNSLIHIVIWDFVFETRAQVKIPRIIKEVLTLLLFFTAILGIVNNVFGHSISGLLAASGAAGLLLGLAAKNLIADVFDGVAINLDSPFQIGDNVFLHDRFINKDGKVLEVTWRTTRFETDHAGILIVPNSLLSNMAISNLSENKKITSFLSLRLDESIPTDRALTILEGVAIASPEILSDPEPKCRITDFENGNIEYTLSYGVNAEKNSPKIIKHNLSMRILNHLELAGIPLAKNKINVMDTKAISYDYASPPDAKEILMKSALFSALRPEEMDYLVAHITLHQVDQGTEIVTLNQQADSMYLLAEGLLSVLIKLESESDLLRVAYLTAGQYFGEMSLLTGAARTATVMAETHAILYELTKPVMTHLIQARPELMNSMSQVVATRLAENTQLEADYHLKQQSSDKQSESTVNTILRNMKQFFGLG